MIQVDKQYQQKKSRLIKYKINHPKLSALQYIYPSYTPWKELSQQLTNNILKLFQNYHFQVDNQPIKYENDYKQLIVGDNKNYFQFQVVFEHYKYASAMHHFTMVKKMLKNIQNLYYLMKPVVKELKETNDIQVELIINELVPETFMPQKWSIDQIIIPNYKNELWNPKKREAIDLVQLFQLSGFNPPPKYAEFAGDLFYIHLKTLQNVDYHITACPLGFYLNQSKINSYNPSIQTNKHIFTNIIDLITSVSDKFSNLLAKQFQYFENNISQKLYKRNHDLISTNRIIQSKKWLDNTESQHYWNNRKQNFVQLEIFDEMNVDWNQQFLNLQKQADTLREFQEEWISVWESQSYRALYLQFKMAAMQGVKQIVEGRVQAINHMDQKRKHIYIYNRIFFSSTFQNPYDHSLPKEQDAVPSDSSSNTDLNNLQILWNMHPKTIRLLHSLIVNYRGYKFIAQTIIPGILSSDINSITQYGTLDGGKTVQAQQGFTNMIAPICDKLHLDNNIEAYQNSGNIVNISISPQIKGIKSISGQYYLCDIQKLSPRDLNYTGLKNQGCVLRQKLINQYIQDNKIDFRYNPTLNPNIGTSVKFKSNEKTVQQEQFLINIAKYLKEVAIVKLINFLKSKNAGDFLTDSKGISNIFHQYGVNMRYIGFVQKHQLLKQNIEIRLCLKRVIFVRTVKHLFRQSLRYCNSLQISSVITHLLNCIYARKQVLLQYNNDRQQQLQEKIQTNQSKKKKKKRNKQEEKEPKNIPIQQTKHIKIQPTPYINKTPQDIWEQIKKIALERFDFQLENSVFQFHQKGLFHLVYHKYVVLRDLCNCLGIVLEKKEYFIKEYQKQNDGLPFNSRNILYFIASPKSICCSALEKLINLKTQADKYFIACSYRDALILYTELCQLIRQQRQGEHILSYCLGQMSRIEYYLGHLRHAIMIEAENLILCQKLDRQDSLQVIKCYSRLGLYCMGVDNRQKSIWFLYKGLYLMLMSFGQTYPDILVNFANIAKVYQSNKQIGRASSCYLKAIQILSQIYGGKNHVNISFCYSSLASLQYEIGQFKKSFQYQNQAVSILHKVLSTDDQRYLDATRILKMYRQISNTKAYNRPIDSNPKDRKK